MSRSGAPNYLRAQLTGEWRRNPTSTTSGIYA